MFIVVILEKLWVYAVDSTVSNTVGPFDTVRCAEEFIKLHDIRECVICNLINPDDYKPN